MLLAEDSDSAFARESGRNTNANIHPVLVDVRP